MSKKRWHGAKQSEEAALFGQLLETMAAQNAECVPTLTVHNAFAPTLDASPALAVRLQTAATLAGRLISQLQEIFRYWAMMRDIATFLIGYMEMAHAQTRVAWQLGRESSHRPDNGTQTADEDLAELDALVEAPARDQLRGMSIFQTQLATDAQSLWDAWRLFCRQTWQVDATTALAAWFPDAVPELLTALNAASGQTDSTLVTQNLREFAAAWQEVLMMNGGE